jgi:hypothetical protein
LKGYAIEIRLQNNYFTGLQRELEIEVFQERMLAIQGENGMRFARTIPLPPAITSAVIEQVKALPKKDVTFLFLSSADLYTLPNGVSKRFDLGKFHSGRKTKVLNHLQILAGDPL